MTEPWEHLEEAAYGFRWDVLAATEHLLETIGTGHLQNVWYVRLTTRNIDVPEVHHPKVDKR